MLSYTIKPLEWRQTSERRFEADTIFGTLRIGYSGQSTAKPYWWKWHALGVANDSVSPDAAKHFAEADYRDRLLAALTPAGERDR